MENRWTKEEWENHIQANCTDSYTLAICCAALLLAENAAKEPHELLINNMNGLSGIQAEIAIKLSDKIRGAEWLDE